MKKGLQILGVVVAIAVLAGCSNNNSNKNSRRIGTATFFNYVTGTSTLTLESIANDRGLGTVAFEHFGPGIELAPKIWDLTVKDLRDETDGSDDVLVLDDVDFTVTYRKRNVHALVGDYDANNVQLVSLNLAFDEEFGDADSIDDEDILAEDKAQYINFSSLFNKPVNIYLVEEADANVPLSSIDTSKVIMRSVAFGESSDNVRIEEGRTNFYLRVALASDSTQKEIYNSGKKTLKDYIEQTIIIAPYVGKVDTGSQITAFYYGTGVQDKWLAANSKGQVRVFNALSDSASLDYMLSTNNATDVDVNANLGFKALSPYKTVSTSSVTFAVTPVDSVGGSSFFDGIGQVVNVQDGESWTVIFFGRVDSSFTSSAIAVLEDDNLYSNQASFTITNAAYIYDELLRKPLNIHIKLASEPLDANSVDIPSLGYGQYGEMTLNSGNNYQIYVTDENNITIKAQPVSFTVSGGENFHYVLIENPAGGMQIVKL